MTPLARAVNWVNSYVIDGIVNGVGFLTKGLGKVVYGGLDQRGIDLAINAVAAANDEAGSLLRKMQTGKVQQYAASFVTGAVVLVVIIVIFNN